MGTEEIHISKVKAGDAILHEGKVMTVCVKDIKRDQFMGLSVFGDSYRLGTRKVKRVLFPSATTWRAAR